MSLADDRLEHFLKRVAVMRSKKMAVLNLCTALMLSACVNTAAVVASTDQVPTKIRACEVYKIDRPTVIAFFDYEGSRDSPTSEDSLDDFQFMLRRLRNRLDPSTIRIHECYKASFDVEVRGQRKTFRKKSAGYYLITRDKDARVEIGVVTDDDLIQVMEEYFGSDVVNKALNRGK